MEPFTSISHPLKKNTALLSWDTFWALCSVVGALSSLGSLCFSEDGNLLSLLIKCHCELCQRPVNAAFPPLLTDVDNSEIFLMNNQLLIVDASLLTSSWIKLGFTWWKPTDTHIFLRGVHCVFFTSCSVSFCDPSISLLVFFSISQQLFDLPPCDIYSVQTGNYWGVNKHGIDNDTRAEAEMSPCVVE